MRISKMVFVKNLWQFMWSRNHLISMQRRKASSYTEKQQQQQQYNAMLKMLWAYTHLNVMLTWRFWFFRWIAEPEVCISCKFIDYIYCAGKWTTLLIWRSWTLQLYCYLKIQLSVHLWMWSFDFWKVMIKSSAWCTISEKLP